MLKNPAAVDNPVESRGTAIPGGRDSHVIMDEYRLSTLFQSYLNNKMTLLFFHIQAKRSGRNHDLVESSSRFLEDAYRHMLSPGPQRKYRWLFKWLKIFLGKLPQVSEKKRKKAKELALCVYDALGLHFKPNNI
ncbi:MAG: hypothetical protein V1882_09735 [Candidatus Omnitrophota bacterium]